MFDIGFFEILLISVVALLVLGPDKLPGAIRTVGLWVGRLRRSFNSIKADIEREVGADEIRRQLRNEEIMAKIKSTRQQFTESVDSVKKEVESVKQETESVKKDTEAVKQELDKEFSSLTGQRAGDRVNEIAGGKPTSEVPHSGGEGQSEKPAVQPIEEPASPAPASGGDEGGKAGQESGQGQEGSASSPTAAPSNGGQGQDEDSRRKEQ